MEWDVGPLLAVVLASLVAAATLPAVAGVVTPDAAAGGDGGVDGVGSDAATASTATESAGDVANATPTATPAGVVQVDPRVAGDPAGGGASAAAGEAIRTTYTVDRTPSSVGTVAVRFRAELPDNVRSLRLTVPDAFATVSGSGFAHSSGDTWTWDGETASPTLSYVVAANDTADGRVNSVETASWAFLTAGQFSLSPSWSYTGDAPAYHRSIAAADEGYGTGSFVYLGPYTTFEAPAENQTLRYVRPAAADPVEPARATLAAVADVANRTDVGAKDPLVTMFVAPSPMRGGGQAGARSFWVSESAALDTADNTWYHEYYHTRQSFRTRADLVWFTEASASYAAARATYVEGRIGHDEFRSYVATDEHADAVLAGNRTGQYTKGRRVLGALDVAIRQATGEHETLAAVLERANERQQLDLASFKTVVERVTGERFDAWIDSYVTTRAAPPIPADVEPAYTGPPALEGTAAPTDPDGDGLYEDLSGNGAIDNRDIIIYFGAMDIDGALRTDAYRPFVDYTDNGEIDYQDLIMLFDAIGSTDEPAS